MEPATNNPDANEELSTVTPTDQSATPPDSPTGQSPVSISVDQPDEPATPDSPASPDLSSEESEPAAEPEAPTVAPVDPVAEPEAPVVVSSDAAPAESVTSPDSAPSDPFADPAAPVVGGPEPTAPVIGGSDAAPPAMPTSMSSPKRSPLKTLLIALVVVLVIGIGSAAAYLGVVLPNKPINVLKMSLANSLQQPQSSFKGSMETSPTAGGVAYKADFSGASDSTAKAADIQLNLTVMGVSFPIEGRLVNKNVYVKVGDLQTIASLASAYSPNLGSLATTLSSQLSNKWIVIDSTLLNQSGAGCYLNASWGLTNDDINLLNKVYDKNPFVTIKSTGSDLVNGQKAEKFVLSIDNDKIAAYGNDKSLDNLSLAKAAQKCSKTPAQSSNLKGNHKQTPLTVWVDKGKKRIVKIAYQNKDGSTEITLDYNKVAITAPANAESAVQVLANIQQAAAADPALVNLLSGAGAGSMGGTTAQ